MPASLICPESLRFRIFRFRIFRFQYIITFRLFWQTALTQATDCVIMTTSNEIVGPGGFVKKVFVWIIGVAAVVLLVVISYLTYSWWSPVILPWLAWLRDLVGAQDLRLFLPALVLILIALAEVILGFVFRQRNRVFESERNAASALHQQEVDLLARQIALLQEEKEQLGTQLRVRNEMVQQERSLLLARLERLQRDAGIVLGLMVPSHIPSLSSRSTSNIEQVLNRLERIELTMDAARPDADEPGSEAALSRAADWLRLGNAYYEIGLPSKAMTYYARAQALRPDDVIPHVNYGFSLVAQGNMLEAIEAFDRAARVDSTSPYPYHGRGMAYEALGRERRAIEDYNKTIKLAPDFAEAFYSRGLVLEHHV